MSDEMLSDHVTSVTYQTSYWMTAYPTRPNKGRWIVVVSVPGGPVLHGFRYQSKAEARRRARREASNGALRAAVRRFRRRQWAARASSPWMQWGGAMQFWLFSPAIEVAKAISAEKPVETPTSDVSK